MLSLRRHHRLEDAWVKTIEELTVLNQGFLEQRIPGYYKNEGSSLLDSEYGVGLEAFFALIRDWREEGTLAGLDLS